jgi:hypothetical protein
MSSMTRERWSVLLHPNHRGHKEAAFCRIPVSTSDALTPDAERRCAKADSMLSNRYNHATEGKGASGHETGESADMRCHDGRLQLHITDKNNGSHLQCSHRLRLMRASNPTWQYPSDKGRLIESLFMPTTIKCSYFCVCVDRRSALTTIKHALMSRYR